MEPTKRDLLLPALAQAFVEVGYRRATTAELARRCQVQENVLYRIWPDKLSIFADAIDYVTSSNLRVWRKVLAEAPPGEPPLERLLHYESSHLGEFRNYRIVFSALAETQEPQIREALQRMYHRIHCFFLELLAAHAPVQALRGEGMCLAWGVMGVGTMLTILAELGMMTGTERREVLETVVGPLIGATGRSVDLQGEEP